MCFCPEPPSIQHLFTDLDITSIYSIIHFNFYADDTQLYLLTRPTSTVSLFSLSRNEILVFLQTLQNKQWSNQGPSIANWHFYWYLVISSSTVRYNPKPTSIMSIGLRIFIYVTLTASANHPHASVPQFPFTICIDNCNSLLFGLSLSCLPINFNWSGTPQVASSPQTPQLIISLLFSSMSTGSQSNTALMWLIDHLSPFKSSFSLHLNVRPARWTTTGSRAFCSSAHHLWISLPLNICNTETLSSFTYQFKTLFKLAHSNSPLLTPYVTAMLLQLV